MDTEIQELLKTLVLAQTDTQRSIGEMSLLVSRYVDAADPRIRRIEENLDGLIRAITREHSNGKGQ